MVNRGGSQVKSQFMYSTTKKYLHETGNYIPLSFYDIPPFIYDIDKKAVKKYYFTGL